MPNSPQSFDDTPLANDIARSVATAIAPGPHRMTVGLRPLAAADWIVDGADFTAQLRERTMLMREREDVLRALPGSQAAQSELLALLVEHLRMHLPARYAFSAPNEPPHVTVRATGQTVPLHADHGNGQSTAAIRNAAHLVAEDLCLMQAGDDGRYRLTAAALCFPTRWKLADKIGQPLLDIHAPVPGYASAVGMATDRVIGSLDAARPVWRQNWSLLDSPALYQPERIELEQTPGAATPQTEPGRRLWMRSERQTLRRLPQSGAVLFTIRIRQCTLDALCAEPGVAGRLLKQLQTMPQTLKVYKGLDHIDHELCAYLSAASRARLRS